MNEIRKDPVCGKKVVPRRTRWKFKFGDHPYYFCTLKCLMIFDCNKKRFMNQRSDKAGGKN
jgi:YHS domain-containing protein